VRGRRQEFSQDGVMVFREPGRTIFQDDRGGFIQSDETGRFRDLGGPIQTERRGDELVTVFERPNGVRVITVTDENGQLLRRIRRSPDGREMVMIDNSFQGRGRSFDEQVIDLPPPDMSMERDLYIVDAGRADGRMIYDTLTAPPVARIPRRYTLDEVRRSPTVRAYTRSVDVCMITFPTGSWDITPDQASKLATLAQGMGQAIVANPNEVFLVEGHTDAVGNPVDNMSLSDRRAQSVATILTRDYNIPPENLTSQGYGSQYPRVQTQGPSAENRCVTVRRITDLLAQQQAAPAAPQ
jgi:outer membrane protein OmpA-like peptidoglycan-associated protein